MTIDVEFGSPLPPIEIEAEGYLMRPFRLEDLPLIEEASSDGPIPLITTVPSDWSPQAGEAFIDRQNSRLSEGEGWSLAIVERRSTRAIGQIGLWIPHLHKGRVEMGYWVAASGRGRGAASQAVEAVSDWAFEHLDVRQAQPLHRAGQHRVHQVRRAGRLPTRRAASKLGTHRWALA